jgi:hypothetical protein
LSDTHTRRRSSWLYKAMILVAAIVSACAAVGSFMRDRDAHRSGDVQIETPSATTPHRKPKTSPTKAPRTTTTTSSVPYAPADGAQGASGGALATDGTSGAESQTDATQQGALSTSGGGSTGVHDTGRPAQPSQTQTPPATAASTNNNNAIAVDNGSSQSSRTGDARVDHNTNGGDATSGDSHNENDTETVINVSN